MLIPYSVTQSYSLLRAALSDAALVDLDKIMRAVANESPAVQREAMMDLLPTLGDQYASATGEVAAVFSAELMELQEVKKPVAPETLALPPAQSWFALAGFGLSDRTLERGGMLLAYSLIAGGLTKRLTEFAADTMIGNASIQSVATSAARVPKPGCCAFCGMLASRGAVYSEESAGVVGGRGVPVGQGQGRGSKGRGRGIKTRGSRAIGESFHDHCRCEVVALTAGNEAQLQADADRYYEAYRESADKVNDGLTLKVTDVSTEERLKNKYEWVNAEGEARNAKERTADILSAMRLDLGVK
ncbi:MULTISPECIES: hypothetical protein [Actinomycetes]|uniref:VG15 protein n=1 Tax=Actinomycetes TaxID=1760 RepID=UPI0034328D9A